MNTLPKTIANTGIVTGPYAKEYIVCQYTKMSTSRSIWFGDSPLGYSMPTLAIKITLIFIATRIIYLFLKPLQQSISTAHILAGILIGPSILARIPWVLNAFFPAGTKVTIQIFAEFGYILQLFILGVQIDAKMLKKAGSQSAFIGCASFVLPYVIGGLSYLVINHIVPLDPKLTNSLLYIITFNSISSFPVITNVLNELNILNSEIGRLATYTSMISDTCCWLWYLTLNAVGVTIRSSPLTSLLFFGWLLLFILAIVFILKPAMIWLTKRTVKGDRVMEELQLFVILVMVLACAFCSEILGQHASFGAFVLGIALPVGPPIGTTVVNKLDTLASSLFLPIFFAFVGFQTNLFTALGKYAIIIELIICIGYFSKFIATTAAALYCGLPFRDAVSLALIMCCRGIIEVSTYSTWMDKRLIDVQTFNLLLITMLIVTGFARPLVSYLYDPSRRYMAYERRSILHSKQDMQLRILACVHREDDAPTIINLLEASNPTRYSPISIFILHLMELEGRATSLLVPHHSLDKLTAHASNSEHVINAFNHYEKRHQGSVVVQHFTAIAPFASIHDDVCTVAVDKRTTIVIVPFHKHWAIDGKVEYTTPAIRHINQNVMNKAPCSVGVLIDRSRVGGNPPKITSHSTYRIALLFIGGADDREALAYCKRMAEHPNIIFTLFRLKSERKDLDKESNLDNELVGDFRLYEVGKERIIYKEEIVRDSVETTQVIGSLEHDFEMVIVGRFHDPHSPLILGLREWSECPELGAIGDMLATSDFSFSVLVVQQQPPEEALLKGKIVDSGAVYPHNSDEESVATSTRLF